MTNFFTISTLAPWEVVNPNELALVKLMSLKDIFKKFPVVEPAFFDDIISKSYNNTHYSWVQSIKRVVGPNNEDYDISNFNFLWAMDTDNRFYQFLFQKIEEDNTSKAILVALAPLELGKLFKDYQSEALLKILSLLNTPQKIRFLMILAPKGKSIVEEQQVVQVDKNYLDKLKFINTLGQMPNISGQYFPQYQPVCPICNEVLTELKELNVGIGFGKLVCTRCGYEKIK